jgi:F1F0 ATPase subunit 2
MSEYLHLLLALLEGAFLGVFFFYGLWMTVRKLESSKQVALLFFVSMLLRTSIVMLGFYFILGDNWQHLVAGLIGFVIVRIIVTRITRSTDQSKNIVTAGGS